ncbi:excalibur calcium-binding domain-containing protein [Streptomyces achromogenes]|uniref:excalibur calcium-binding domain-containing protein n=1 Tax=Streptomyces achromogenes TaxID=67255 RepID=UPI003F4CE808
MEAPRRRPHHPRRPGTRAGRRELPEGPEAVRAPRPRPRALRRCDGHGDRHADHRPRARSHRDGDPYRQGDHDGHGAVGVRRRHPPLYAGDPGYDSHLDRDGDGVACE